jgi:hypothetical protein
LISWATITAAASLLLGRTAPPAPAPAPVPEPRRIRHTAPGPSRPTVTPWQIAAPPPGVVPEGAATMAQDDALTGLYAYASASNVWGEGLQWFGYPFLAELAQRAEYRQISETLAKEMTRKWITIQATGSDDGKADKVRALELAFKRLKVQQAFRRAAELDGLFGRAQIYIDTGCTDDPDELRTRLTPTPEKISRGGLKGLRVVEPLWTYPTDYNSIDPLRPNYFVPRAWFVQGRHIDATRLLTFVSREMPDMLKPAYSFGGLSMSQLAYPYVENWLRTRQSVSDMLHTFSVTGLKTNMQVMTDDEVFQKAQFFNNFRDNRGLMMIDKEADDFFNISAPLGGLDHLQAQAQEQMASVARIPLVVLLGITPSGLNASSDGEIRTFYAWIEAQQEALFADHLNTVLKYVQLSEFGEVDPEIGFRFNPCWTLDEEKQATVRKTQADTAAVYIQAGVLSPHEERERIAQDEDSPYAALDLADREDPTPPADPAAEGDPLSEPDNDNQPPPGRPDLPHPAGVGRPDVGRPGGPGRPAASRPVGPGRPDVARGAQDISLWDLDWLLDKYAHVFGQRPSWDIPPHAYPQAALALTQAIATGEPVDDDAEFDDAEAGGFGEDAGFEEADHPRDQGGKFTSGAGSGGGSTKGPTEKAKGRTSIQRRPA